MRSGDREERERDGQKELYIREKEMQTDRDRYRD
jgi:hypothetical protein